MTWHLVNRLFSFGTPATGGGAESSKELGRRLLIQGPVELVVPVLLHNAMPLATAASDAVVDLPELLAMGTGGAIDRAAEHHAQGSA